MPDEYRIPLWVNFFCFNVLAMLGWCYIEAVSWAFNHISIVVR